MARCLIILLAGKQRFHIVSQLPGGELVAFEIGGQAALAINYQGVQRVRYVEIGGPEIQAEAARNGLHFVEWSGEEVPGFRIGFPGRCVFFEDCGLVVDRVKADAEEDEVTAHAAGETLVQLAEVVGEPRVVDRA